MLARLIREAVRHRRALRAVPLRIHVNGSRGKSTVVRLTAAGLRAAGLRVVAKVTGASPALIHPDGREACLARRGRARLLEQVDVVRRAARLGADALVLECMAIRPETQRVAEHRIVRATLGVLTNVRSDHGEVFGDSAEAMAGAFAAAFPRGTVVVTAARVAGGILEAGAARAGSRLVAVDGDELPAPLREALPPWLVEENLTLALRACEEAGVPRRVAAEGIRRWLVAEAPPAGFRLPGERGDIRFLPAFSANDAASAEMVLERLRAAGWLPAPVVPIVNGRWDRPVRAVQFGRLLARLFPRRSVLLIGDAARLTARAAVRAGKPAEQLHRLGGAPPAVVLARLRALLPDGGSAVGLGNLGGAGRTLLDHVAREGSRL